MIISGTTLRWKVGCVISAAADNAATRYNFCYNCNTIETESKRNQKFVCFCAICLKDVSIIVVKKITTHSWNTLSGTMFKRRGRQHLRTSGFVWKTAYIQRDCSGNIPEHTTRKEGDAVDYKHTSKPILDRAERFRERGRERNSCPTQTNFTH